MEYVIYIDILFLADFILDFLALLLSSVFFRKEPSVLRLVLAAIIGSLWTCILAVWPSERSVPQIVELLFTVFGAGSFINFLAFNWEEKQGIKRLNLWFRKLFLADILLLITSAILNGCLSLFREHFYLSDWECLVCTGISTGTVMIFLKETLKKKKVGDERYSVTLYYEGKQRKFTGLADSGNRLRVPETGKPVTIISFKDCAGFCEKTSGGFFIPYRAVGTDHGLLFAITFEKIEIQTNRTCMKIENPVIAITKEPLSINGDFNMILPEEYILDGN